MMTELCFNGKCDKGVDAGSHVIDKSTKIIVLTSLSNDWLIRSSMRLGAKTFLTKTYLSQELCTAGSERQFVSLGRFLEHIVRCRYRGTVCGIPP